MVILTGIVSKITEYTVEPIGRQVGYVIDYKINLENLRRQLENLDAAKDRMNRTVNEVERKGKHVYPDVQKWLTEVDEITREAENILGDECQAKTKCFRGVCPNLVSYHQFSRKSTKLAKKIELHAKKEFPSVSYDPPLEEICATPSQNYMAFESRILMVNEIMKELKNPDTNMIGVYGLGGVGKTTLAQDVYRQATKENLFDEVVIVLDVKKYPDLEKKERIQKKIAENFGMDVDGSQDIEARAKHLWNRIKDKNIFVILDDVWEAIDLEALGLCPMATCKILLTSRNRVSEINMEKEFRLEVLSVKENWSLFEKMVGDVVKNDRIHEVATEIAKKCGGLPVSVVAVARSLRSATTLEEWRVALRDFKSFDEHGLAKSAYLALEWSYNRLDENELKPLFLLCGIIAGDACTIFLSDLLKYAMGLSLMKNVDTVEEARDKLISLAKKLIKDYCLLLDTDDGYLRMHELVRDVAMGIAFKDKHVIAKAYGDELKEWPDMDFFKKCTAISLKSCKIPRLPEEPWVCPELRFFVLGSCNVDDSLEIPGNYFKGMNELKVLDVTGLRILSLPPSLQSLTNLQTLCLDQCVLGDIALVGQLTNLKILSLIHSQVKELPEEIGQLTRLQLLDLTDCSELVRIPPGVISSLISLEDLRMGSFEEWEGEGSLGRRTNASVSELKQLRQLTALEIHIPDAKLLPANMFSDTRLDRYTILIGDCWPRYPRIYGTSSNMLKLKLTMNSQFGQGIKLLLQRCEDLDLDGMEAANIIYYILASDSGKQLKKLRVQNNDAVTAVINSSHAFPNLESLSLYNLVNLETVCCGQLIAQPFQKLRSLTLWNLPKLIGFSSKGSTSVVSTEAEEIILENEIGGPTKLFMNGEVLIPNLTHLILHQCDGLRFLFSRSMARRLEQLKHLEISTCQMMEEIVSTSGYNQEHTDNMFCNLKYLKLQHLPSLTRFCSGSYIEFSLLETLHIEDCPRLGTFIFDGKSEITTIMGKENDDRNSKENLETVIPHFLFDQKVGFPSLERLIIYDLPALMTIWHNQLAQDSFCRLKEVQVYRCHNLINIFARSMMGRLNALYRLEIWQCQLLQVVFELGGVFEAYDTSTTQLKTFECPNLDFVRIDACERLINIFSATVAENCENCELMEINVKEKGLEATPKFVFPKVTVVKFENLPQLRMFYPGMHVSEWPLLKELEMTGCHNMEIFAYEISRFQKKLELGIQCTPIKYPLFLVEKVLMPKLTSLIVGGCGGLRFLFSSSMARSLVQLKNLKISKCQIMEEIVPTNGSSEEDTDHNMFSQLQDLKLQYLPNLTRFCSARHSINFHSLEILLLKDCSKLETFIFDPMSTNSTINKATVEIWDSMEDIGTDAQYFLFDEKVGFPSLKSLIIRDMPQLRTIWHRQLGPDSFRKLKEVEVSGCDTLINIFTPSMMGRLNALGTLVIEQCKSLQVVFDMGVILGVKEAYGTLSTTQLKTVGCPNLDSVVMDSCDSLKNIFPASLAKGLQQLSELYVRNCEILEEIVANDGLETTPEFVFSKVTLVQLRFLPQLSSFYLGLHVSKWPLLKSLRFFKCGKVEILASEYSGFQEKLDSGTPIKQPFLLVDKGYPFPNLEELYLDMNMEIWYEAHSPLPAELFINLKKFRFSCAHPQSFHFLQKLHNLEEFVVYNGPWKEIFVYEGTSSGEIDVGRTLPHIKNLCLNRLRELMHLGIGNDISESVFPNLEILKVYNCEGLKYLTTYSVAKCLHQLKSLEVENCESMIEIVASNEDEEDSGNYYEIAFSCLQHLKLYNLPSLRGCCSSGNCTVRVPSLNSLIVKKCLIELKISPDGSLIQSGRKRRRRR